MTSLLLEPFLEIAHEAIHSKDLRPDWLKALPGAMDEREPYYKFLMLLARKAKPNRILEIGTRGGTSIAHMMYGHPCASQFTTMDIDPECSWRAQAIADSMGLGHNFNAITGDSSKSSDRVCGVYNLLFIDGDHTYVSSYGDYVLYREKVADGGIIVFDDTRLSDEMKRAWDRIADTKIEIPELHYMGFGVAIKTTGVNPLPL